MPESPVAARKVTPGTWKVESRLNSSADSDPPQLMETTEASLPAVATAEKRSGSKLVFASTRMMLAAGAMAWAHSMSIAISVLQP